MHPRDVVRPHARDISFLESGNTDRRHTRLAKQASVSLARNP